MVKNLDRYVRGQFIKEETKQTKDLQILNQNITVVSSRMCPQYENIMGVDLSNLNCPDLEYFNLSG